MLVSEALRTLGVESVSSSAELKDAYRRALREAHPDTSETPEAHQRITVQQARSAYSTLSEWLVDRPLRAGAEGRVAPAYAPSTGRTAPPPPPRPGPVRATSAFGTRGSSNYRRTDGTSGRRRNETTAPRSRQADDPVARDVGASPRNRPRQLLYWVLFGGLWLLELATMYDYAIGRYKWVGWFLVVGGAAAATMTYLFLILATRATGTLRRLYYAMLCFLAGSSVLAYIAELTDLRTVLCVALQLVILYQYHRGRKRREDASARDLGFVT